MSEDKVATLLWACANDHKMVTELLVETGVNINATTDVAVGILLKLVGNVDKDGLTPLHRACQNGHADVAKLLVEHGADVNAQGTSHPRRASNH
jgi:ankyrin repeat protein